MPGDYQHGYLLIIKLHKTAPQLNVHVMLVVDDFPAAVCMFLSVQMANARLLYLLQFKSLPLGRLQTEQCQALATISLPLHHDHTIYDQGFLQIDKHCSGQSYLSRMPAES